MKHFMFLAALTFGLVGEALAERVDHFQGEAAETLQAAVEHFTEYNQRLEALLAQETLSDEELVQVHELTYTLENALETISAEVAELAEELEEVHLASERLDAEGVKSHGRVYLDKAKVLIDAG
ncbi:DUF6746 family protein [Halomonas sp. 328]|uniref:DUF6746 family protein n=1 Tax=Halomonas sp. 328 TaxID=2776704 RepID=UPI0018A7DE08|nr:DUF6746 family protein [Halomonas sp. 328]MBF8222148.1 hypothetical protein [Halomonas sp. 328]